MKLFTFHDPHDNPEKEPTPERPAGAQERASEAREREKEETKERQQKERARELKEAAKKRGEAIEATRPDPETEEIAPVGEKLRKKWRHALLKKSQRVMDFFRREEPSEIDGVRLAELMVAERIIELNAYLETTEPKTDERRNTKTELDFMGLLSEKLSNPEIEVPVEIAKVHAQIIEESAQSLDEPVVIDVDNLPKFEQQTTSSSEEAVDAAPASHNRAFTRYGLIVLAALGKALHDAPAAVATVSGVAGGAAASVAAHTVIIAPLAAAVASSAATKAVSHTRQPETYRDADPLTAAVVQETIRPISVTTQTETAPVVSGGSSVGSRPSIHAPTPEGVGLSIGHSVEQTAMPAAMEVSSADGRRFEHMNTHELLALASGIAVGHGQYLGRLYQSGQIDRDGLIKVLKAHRRGQDYRSEYVRSARRYQEQRRDAQQSPERLASLDETGSPDTPTQTVESPTDTTAQNPGRIPDISEIRKAESMDSLSRSAVTDADPQRRMLTRIVITAAIVATVTIVLVWIFVF